MRLIHHLSGDEFELVSFNDEPPPYAILSHTWVEGQEVTYQDMIARIGRDKSGFDKIRFTHERAVIDELQYFWVDTCCINKSAASELQSAINSMFRWYKCAKKCYVFLSDVSVPEDVSDPQSFPITWSEAFRQSRWFKRGWTLQELLAPPGVEFFSKERVRLGDKMSLEQHVHQVTKIPIDALRGKPLADFTFDERMSWTATLTTTIAEDKVYCLQGIFGVFLSVLYGEGLDYATSRLKSEIQRHHGAQAAGKIIGNEYLFSNTVSPRGDKALWIVPFQKNTNFVGRSEQLAKVNTLLANESRCESAAIIGLGGVGKTQIALEFAHQWRDEHPDCAVLWIPVTSVGNMLQAYQEIARQLKIPSSEQNTSEVQKLFHHELGQESFGKWLLVFDNVDDLEIWTEKASGVASASRRIDLLPISKHGSILFTSRSRKAALKLAGKNMVSVDEMEPATAKTLLKRSLIDHDLLEDDDAMTDLLLKLTYLPLAIVQAAAYINENDIKLSEYTMLLNDSEENVIDVLSEEFEDEGRYVETKNPIATTWLISFEQIRTRVPLAAEYLSFMSCIAAKDIPLSLLPSAETPKKAIDAIGTLSAYSFVTKHKTGELVDLHRLVHLTTRNWLRSKGTLGHWSAITLGRLAEVFPTDDHANRALWRSYMPHARYVLNSDLQDHLNEMKMKLLLSFGTCSTSDGRYNDAEMAYTESLELSKKLYGIEHRTTLFCTQLLSTMYSKQYRHKKAEQLLVQSLETSQRVFGVDSSETRYCMTLLVLAYLENNKAREAEELNMHLVELNERLGVQVPEELLDNMSDQAWIRKTNNKLKEAEDLYTQVVETKMRVLGLEHTSTLESMQKLALTLYKQHKYIEAEGLSIQVTETRKRVLGKKHPETLHSMELLVSTLGTLNRNEEAKELLVQVLEARQEVLGLEHPDTLATMHSLPYVLLKLNEGEEAIQLMEECFQLRKKVLGKEHPDTLVTMHFLAYVLHKLNESEEAIQLMEECFQLRTKVLGPDHRKTERSLEILKRWKLEQSNLRQMERIDLDN